MGNSARRFGLCLFVFGCIFGCQDLDIEKESGEPCTRTSQCDEGLVCLAGVCLEDEEDGAGAGGDAAFEEARELGDESSDGF